MTMTAQCGERRAPARRAGAPSVPATGGAWTENVRPGPPTAPARSRRAAAGDAPAEDLLRRLYAEHGPALLAYTTRLLNGDRSTAEDTVQETLVRAWQHARVLTEEGGSVRGWLITVARNIVIDHLRRRATRPAIALGNEPVPAAEGDHAPHVTDAVFVRQALKKLSAEHREVLLLVYFEGRTATDAAGVLGVPVGTVKSRTYYALRALRAILFPAPRLLEPVA